MPLLLRALSAILSRLGPAGLPAVLTFLRNATGRAFSSVPDIIAYARANPVQSLLVAEAIVRYVPNEAQAVEQALVTTSLSGDRVNGDAILAGLERLRQIRQGVSQVFVTADATRTGAGATQADTSADVVRFQMGRTLQRYFGNMSNAQDVQRALTAYKPEDFLWFDTMRGAMR
jgi:hypothetical protein